MKCTFGYISAHKHLPGQVWVLASGRHPMACSWDHIEDHLAGHSLHNNSGRHMLVHRRAARPPLPIANVLFRLFSQTHRRLLFRLLFTSAPLPRRLRVCGCWSCVDLTTIAVLAQDFLFFWRTLQKSKTRNLHLYAPVQLVMIDLLHFAEQIGKLLVGGRVARLVHGDDHLHALFVRPA